MNRAVDSLLPLDYISNESAKLDYPVRKVKLLFPRTFPKNGTSDLGQRGRLLHNEQLNPAKAAFEM
jgi:hypothetical protein